MDQTTRILWLSDIHYREKFEFPEVLHKRTKKFHESVEEYLTKSKKDDSDDNQLHYVIISGDLAFSGTKKDYELFDKEIISTLKKIFSKHKQKPVFLCCPGNHDVNRAKSGMYKKLISLLEGYMESEECSDQTPKPNYSEKAKRALLARRESLLHNYGIQDAKMAFKEYTKYIKPLSSEGLSFNTLDMLSYIDNGCLYGQVLDHKQNVIYTILNSSWFSLGDGFDSLIVDYYQKNSKTKLTRILSGQRKSNNLKEDLLQFQKEYFLKVTKMKEMCSEFGKQIVSQKIIEIEKYNENLNRYPHYAAITIFHHPLSWLEESQKYDYENGGETELIKILKKSDILLTGHEHVNVSITPEILYNRLVHIPGGMFIQDKNQYYKGGQNRYAFLEIDNKNKNLSVKNFIWDKMQELWSEYKGETEKWDRIKFERKLSYFITEDMIRPLTDSFKNNFNPLKYLEKNVDINFKNVLPHLGWKIEKGFNDRGNDIEICKYQQYSVSKRSYLIVLFYFPSDTLFLEVANAHKIFQLIDKYVSNAEDSEKHIVFLQLDLITTRNIDNSSGLEKKYYSNPHEGKFKDDFSIREVFYQIQKRADNQFNLFRNSYFLLKEKTQESDNQNTEQNSFSDYINLSFSNLVIPFWSIDDYI